MRLQPLVLASFLRLVTHPRIFVDPMPIEEALRFIDALLALPGVSLAALGEEWPILRQLCLDKALKANAIPNAWLAAAVVRQGGTSGQLRCRFRPLAAAQLFSRR